MRTCICAATSKISTTRAGSLLYTFSGFTVYNVFFNHFVDVVALFPYLLWSLDEALYNDRRSWFAFWVAVNLVNNYFFFIGQVVFLAIYFICKLSTGTSVSLQKVRAAGL